MACAYVVFIREGEIVDPEAMAAYKNAGTGSPPDPNVKPRALYGALETIEGEAADGIVIIEFPSMQAARDWYYGDYHERARLRQKAAPYRGFIVEGL
ncbi:MAG: DUF1330 domain-containing protein [Novosphingobium sp.]|jgi:uncharacterized protein (DUF1330 family)|nr:DUF1330 domain-containing protein [Novosphingobium sp.]